MVSVGQSSPVTGKGIGVLCVGCGVVGFDVGGVVGVGVVVAFVVAVGVGETMVNANDKTSVHF